MKTVISSDAYLIEIEFEGQVYQVLWGIIEYDEIGRWKLGDYVCTTPIQKSENLEDGVTRFLTRSGRIYETTCPVQPYQAKSATEFRFFLAGVSPTELNFFQENGMTIIDTVNSPLSQ